MLGAQQEDGRLRARDRRGRAEVARAAAGRDPRAHQRLDRVVERIALRDVEEVREPAVRDPAGREVAVRDDDRRDGARLEGGEVATISAGPVTVTPAAAVSPKETAASAWKPAPARVTAVPPAAGPEDGDSVATWTALSDAESGSDSSECRRTRRSRSRRGRRRPRRPQRTSSRTLPSPFGVRRHGKVPTKTARPRSSLREDLDVVRRARLAVERPGDRHQPARGRPRREHGEVLQQIRPVVLVHRIVERFARDSGCRDRCRGRSSRIDCG